MKQLIKDERERKNKQSEITKDFDFEEEIHNAHLLSAEKLKEIDLRRRHCDLCQKHLPTITKYK